MVFEANLLTCLQSARWVVVLTGAGISAESNIPTFRDAQTGYWAKYNPEELATREAFRRNPQLVWEWYRYRRELVAQAEPNAGHFALATCQSLIPKLTLITQNVDGLHQRAGSKDVIELHGNLTRVKCFDRDHPVTHWAESEQPVPVCPLCGSFLRPDVVWFGENLPHDTLQRAMAASRQGDLFLVIGTSSVVYPAAALPMEAIQRRVPVAEINPSSTPLTPYAKWVLSGKSGEVLPALLQAAFGEKLQNGDSHVRS